jgi:hypothetical protein
VEGQSLKIGEAWQQEVEVLRLLPTQSYPCCTTVAVRLNPYSQVVLETNRYSVPTDQAQTELVARLYPFKVEIFQPNEAEPIASHARCYGRKQDILDPLHYLPLLQQRPGALNHAKPIRQWRASWPPIYEELLANLQAQWPEGRGVREFIAVLQLHQNHAADLIEQAVQQALAYGCGQADGVKLCLHQLTDPDPHLPSLTLEDQPHLQPLGQQPLDMACYNQLLGGN